MHCGGELICLRVCVVAELWRACQSFCLNRIAGFVRKLRQSYVTRSQPLKLPRLLQSALLIQRLRLLVR